MNDLDNLYREKGRIQTQLEILGAQLRDINSKLINQINSQSKDAKVSKNSQEKENAPIPTS